jgi:hypothetical protein
MKRDRYTVRWITEYVNLHHELRQVGWEVIDWTRFDNVGVQKFEMSESEQAFGLCKLLNSIEEEGANNVRRT